MAEKKWNDWPLREPDKDDLKDEIRNIAATLAERHEMSARGIRQVARKALRPRFKVREVDPVPAGGFMRIATVEDLCQDLEVATIALGESRLVQAAITRGLKDAANY